MHTYVTLVYLLAGYYTKNAGHNELKQITEYKLLYIMINYIYNCSYLQYKMFSIVLPMLLLILWPTLTPVLLNCLFLFFIHSKLQLLTQYPASNDEKYLYI